MNGRIRKTKEEVYQEEMRRIMKEMYAEPEVEEDNGFDCGDRDISYITEMAFAKPPERLQADPK
jgi:hypothetical protein